MSHRIFTYGTLCSGRSNNRLLGNAVLLGSARTQDHYELYDSGAFPGMVDDKRDMVLCKYHVRGEVYEIDDLILRSCDRLEGHPHFYIRKEITVSLDNKWPEVITCFAYFIQPPFYDKWTKLETGLWQPKKLPSNDSMRSAPNTTPADSTRKTGRLNVSESPTNSPHAVVDAGI